jgi:phosphopantetheine adenylyltransferase
MKLSEEIIKHLLPEDDVNTVAIYAGGFKPPTSGHFQVLKQALEEHPDIDELLIYIGKKERDEDDFSDIANRTKSIDKYDNLALAVTVTQGNVSGTAARNAANISIEKLIPFLPKELNDEERVEVFNIINNNLSEGRKKKKDPKKGTGKKPKGSGRRLYTDEDPKDTVGIKFSTRQDIVDTLNKKSFKAKSHARQSQIINLIQQL